jgi:hypothetical protein
MSIRQDNFNNGEDNLIKQRLREAAQQIRVRYLNRPLPHSNVAYAEVSIHNQVFCVGATAKGGKKSPIQQPKPKSEGGQFEPIVDPYSTYKMDTDAEYKVLSVIADTLEMIYDIQVKEDFYIEIEGYLYLYSDKKPCQSCQGIIKQFEDKFPNIKVYIFWDHPYPPI